MAVASKSWDSCKKALFNEFEIQGVRKHFTDEAAQKLWEAACEKLPDASKAKLLQYARALAVIYENQPEKLKESELDATLEATKQVNMNGNDLDMERRLRKILGIPAPLRHVSVVNTPQHTNSTLNGSHRPATPEKDNNRGAQMLQLMDRLRIPRGTLSEQEGQKLWETVCVTCSTVGNSNRDEMRRMNLVTYLLRGLAIGEIPAIDLKGERLAGTVNDRRDAGIATVQSASMRAVSRRHRIEFHSTVSDQPVTGPGGAGSEVEAKSYLLALPSLKLSARRNNKLERILNEEDGNERFSGLW